MKHRCIALLLLPLSLAAARADEAGGTPVRISGFGTAAMTRTNNDMAQFGRPGQGAGARKDPITGVDSSLGLQANATFGDTLSGTIQGLVRKEGEDDYGADLAWAFLKVKVSDKLSFRVGRMGLPVYMISDYRSVGYASTMMRPPGEMYAQVPFNSVDGADASYAVGIDDTRISASMAFGRTRSTLGSGAGTVVHIEGKRVAIFNLVAERGPLTVRLGRFNTTISLDDSPAINGLMSGLRGAGTRFNIAQLAPLADRLELKNKKGSFTSLGVSYDAERVLVQSEIAKRKTDSYANNTTSWYVMGGYRFGKVLPYYSHADLTADSRMANTVPASCADNSPVCNATVKALGAGVTSLLSGGREGEQATDAIGVRWDFHSSAAFKLQVDRVKPKRGQGLFLQAAPGFNGPVIVTAVGVDFVF
jgi:hypothetical protein